MSITSEGFHYEFIHNVFGHFIENTLDYFGDYLYPRFEHQVVATYSKAVEYFTKGDQYGREHDKPNLPALILNPSGEFNLDDANSGAKQMFRFPHLAPGMTPMMYTPIYKDANNIVTVGHTRIKGEIELLMLLNSFYEYCDVKVLLIQIFGGEGRIIEPVNFNSFIIIPPELYNYEYYNDVTNVRYTLDWPRAGIQEVLVKTTNKDEMVINGKIKPRYTLRGMSDNSDRYGGIDNLAEWKLTAQIEYEIELPSFLILESDYLVQGVHFEIRYGSCFTKYENFAKEIPLGREVSGLEWHLPYGLQFKTRYYHVLTQENIDSEEPVYLELTIPERIINRHQVILNSKFGPLLYHDHYRLSTRGDETDVILKDIALENLAVGDIIEVYVYDSDIPVGMDAINPEILSGSINISTSSGGLAGSRRSISANTIISSNVESESMITGVSGTASINSDASALIDLPGIYWVDNTVAANGVDGCIVGEAIENVFGGQREFEFPETRELISITVKIKDIIGSVDGKTLGCFIVTEIEGMLDSLIVATDVDFGTVSIGDDVVFNFPAETVIDDNLYSIVFSFGGTPDPNNYLILETKEDSISGEVVNYDQGGMMMGSNSMEDMYLRIDALEP